MALKRLLEASAIVLLATTVVACGGGSSGSSAPLPASSPPPTNTDTQAPIVAFAPAILTVTSGETGASILSASDNIGVTSGPVITCTNGGSFSSNTFTAPVVMTSTTSLCTALYEDAVGNSGSGELTVTMSSPPAGSVVINGKVTYDFVPHNTGTNALDYENIEQRVVRGLTVEALDSANTVLATDVTDAIGDYSVFVAENIDTRIRVKAEMVQTSGAQWDVRVQDNTTSDALYAIQGSLASSGAANSTRDLNAASGWTGSNSAGSYSGTRAAAPFAIIDPIYDAVQQISAIDTDVVFPPAKFNWSTRNRAANGNLANGEIGTSSYRGNGNIFILGDVDSDTDEYDGHVNVHEWGHYFEDQLSRSDSVGGPHGGGDRLDPRVAMGEGFGNALSGMITDDPFYRDSFGARQQQGFSINVEANNPAGWFNESTVQSILYDIYDSGTEAGDTLSLGLAPIYEALTNANYRENDFFTSIFTFLDQLRTDQPGSVADINSMATSRNINGAGPDAIGETSTGTVASALPLYNIVTVNGPAVEVCSVDDNGSFNKLGNRAYLSFEVTNAGAHTLTMTRTSGATSRDPDFRVFQNGTFVARAEAEPAESEITTDSLTLGAHVVDAYDFFNVQPRTQGDSCYDFMITR